ncbi:hypothetical protein L7F22_067698 [Adiantum nelumboides]|nr:hypothetical protein [Adiantum nelumboides]MCO5613422.1 hypothetical protein [Adiantum nelumboides]
MVGSCKADYLLLCTIVILSLAHLVLADWPPQGKTGFGKKPPGRKMPHRSKHFYDAYPVDDSSSDDEYIEEGQQPPYKPYKPTHYYKAKPTYYKPLAKAPPAPSYTSQPQEPSPPPPPPPPTPDTPNEHLPPQLAAPPNMYYVRPPAYKSAPPPYKKPYTPTPSPPVPVPSPSSSSSWAQQWLGPHNAARAELGLPRMVWSDKVAQFAESWASQRKASGCGLQHSNGPYGENIFWGSGGSYGPAECVAAWVSEKDYYNYGANSCSPGQQCGHYTQIVWATSLNLGCAKVQCDSGQTFMTCNYDPPGNWIGSKPY